MTEDLREKSFHLVETLAHQMAANFSEPLVKAAQLHILVTASLASDEELRKDRMKCHALTLTVILYSELKQHCFVSTSCVTEVADAVAFFDINIPYPNGRKPLTLKEIEKSLTLSGPRKWKHDSLRLRPFGGTAFDQCASLLWITCPVALHAYTDHKPVQLEHLIEYHATDAWL